MSNFSMPRSFMNTTLKRYNETSNFYTLPWHELHKMLLECPGIQFHPDRGDTWVVEGSAISYEKAFKLAPSCVFLLGSYPNSFPSGEWMVDLPNNTNLVRVYDNFAFRGDFFVKLVKCYVTKNKALFMELATSPHLFLRDAAKTIKEMWSEEEKI